MPISQVLTAPTTAPSRTQDKTTFDTNVENRLAWDTTNVTELTTWASQANSTATTVSSDASSASTSATTATASAAAAIAAAGASLWVSGQSYAQGNAAISLVNFQTYRATTSTSGTTDPSASGSWTQISISSPVNVAQGGTGASTLTANYVLLGNGTSALQMIAPSTSGNILTSNGTTWSSTAPAAPIVPAGAIIYTALNFGGF